MHVFVGATLLTIAFVRALPRATTRPRDHIGPRGDRPLLALRRRRVDPALHRRLPTLTRAGVRPLGSRRWPGRAARAPSTATVGCARRWHHRGRRGRAARRSSVGALPRGPCGSSGTVIAQARDSRRARVNVHRPGTPRGRLRRAAPRTAAAATVSRGSSRYSSIASRSRATAPMAAIEAPTDISVSCHSSSSGTRPPSSRLTPSETITGCADGSGRWKSAGSWSLVAQPARIDDDLPDQIATAKTAPPRGARMRPRTMLARAVCLVEHRVLLARS